MKKTNGSRAKMGMFGRTATIITAVALAAALIAGIAAGLLPGAVLEAEAAGGVLESISGGNVIPDSYTAVNVPAGTKVLKSGASSPTAGDGLAAFDFHIFAVNFASGIHTCGNIAVKNLGAAVAGRTGAPEFGSRQNHDTRTIKLSYVENIYDWCASANADKFVFGPGNKVKNNNNQIFLTDVKGRQYLMGNGTVYTDKIFMDDSTPYIDIEAELLKTEDYQRYLVWLGSGKSGESVKVINGLSGTGSFGASINLSGYSEETIIINLTADQARNTLRGMVDIKGAVGKRVIFNVDTKGISNFTFSDTTMTADTISNAEDSVHKDNNILWNFYDSTNTYTPSTSTITVGGTWVGTVLAPEATVKCNAGLNGSIIAHDVTTTCETHKSDYTGEKVTGSGLIDIPVTKLWRNDNPATRPKLINIKLLQNGKVYKTAQISGSGNSWSYTFEQVPVRDGTGTTYRYTVEEEVPSGYTGSVVNYSIINTGSGAPVEETPVYGNLVLNKKDGSGKLIAGASFRMTGGSKSLAGVTCDSSTVQNFRATDSEVTWTTVEGKGAKITNIPAGTYIVTETGAPAGYKIGTASQGVTVESGTKTVNVTNEKITVSVAKLESANRDMLPGASLKLTADGGAVLTAVEVSNALSVEKNGNSITWISTSRNVVFTGLPAGSYTLSEVVAPTGYDMAVPVNFTIDTYGNVTGSCVRSGRVELLDDEHVEPQPPVLCNVIIRKTENAEGTVMVPGATLRLTSLNGIDLREYPEIGISGSGFAYMSSDGTSLDLQTTSEQLEINNLPEGIYTLSETAAPAGYKPAAQMVLSVEEFGANTWVMVDEPVEVSISKKDATSGAEIAGAEMKITAADSRVSLSGVTGSGVTVTGSTVTWTSAGEQTVISRLPSGRYTLEEVKAPDGYALNTEKAEFTVDSYGNVTGTTTLYDRPTVISVDKQYQLTNGSTGRLPGAVLRLTGSKPLVNVTGTVQVTRDDDYSIVWTSAGEPNSLRGIPDGSYTLRELEAPTDFDKAADISFEVRNGVIEGYEDNTVIMTDKETVYNSVEITKISSEDPDKKPVAGAVLGVFDKNADSYMRSNAKAVITTTDGEMVPLMLPDGDYVLVELEAPEGFTKTTDKIHFTVKNNSLSCSVDSREQAAASNGNTKEAGLNADVNGYFTLETSEIFSQYGKFPKTVAFDLPSGFECTNLTLYEDVEDRANVIFDYDIPAVTPNSDGSRSYSVPVAAQAESGGREYHIDRVYYAVLQLNRTGASSGAEVERVDLQFEYPKEIYTNNRETGGAKLAEDDCFTIAKATSSSEAYANLNQGSNNSTLLTNGNAADIWPTTITITPTGDDRYSLGTCTFEIKGESEGASNFNTVFARWNISSLTGGSNVICDKNNPIILTMDNTDGAPSAYNKNYDYILKGEMQFHDGGGYVKTNPGFTVVCSYGGSGSAPEEEPGSDIATSSMSITLDSDDYGFVPSPEGNGGGTVVLRMPNNPTPEVESHQCRVVLSKVSDTGNIISGAKFLLYNANGELVPQLAGSNGSYAYDKDASADTVNIRTNPLTTGSDGRISVDGLEPGSYFFYETEAPSGYEMTSQRTDFVLNVNHNGTMPCEVTVENREKTGALTVIKSDDGGSLKEGAEFELYRVRLDKITSANNSYSEVQTAISEGSYDSLNIEKYPLSEAIVTSDNGQYTVSGLPAGYIYFIVETRNPLGTTGSGVSRVYPQLTGSSYTVNSQAVDFGVVLAGMTPNATVNGEQFEIFSGVINAVNESTQLTVVKTDGSSPLAGATFRITPKMINGNRELLAEVSAAGDMLHRTEKSGSLDANGAVIETITDEYIEWTTDTTGSNTFRGIPAGAYILSEVTAPFGYGRADDAEFTVNSDGSVSMTAAGGVSASGTAITVNDTKVTGKLTLVKYDSVSDGQLDGVKFMLQASDDGENWTDVEEYTTVNGRITAENLIYGKYYRFRETAALTGYILPSGGEEFSEAFRIFGDTLENKTYMYNDRRTGSIRLTKTDESGSPLEGAEFVLLYKGSDEPETAYAACPFGDELYVTDGSGVITADGLPWGFSYRFCETKAPEGYDMTTDEYDRPYTDAAVFTASDTAEKTLTCVNRERSCSVELSGTKTLTGREFLEGESYRFVIKDGFGKTVSTATAAAAEAGGNVISFSFKPIVYKASDLGKSLASGKTFSYTVSEEVPAQTGGVEYDSTEYELTVSVRESSGRLTADSVLTKNGRPVGGNIAAFTNIYEAAGTTASITGVKNVVDENGAAVRGIDMTAFSFGLYSNENCTAKLADAVWNGSSFTLTTPELSEDTVCYIKEIIPAVADRMTGITYSTEVYKWELAVEDDSAGSYNVTAQRLSKKNASGEWEEVSADALSFTNSYKPLPCGMEISGTKQLVDDRSRNVDLGSREFSFGIWEAERNGSEYEKKTNMPAAQAKNDASGSFTLTLPDDYFTDEGTYSFIVEEIIPTELQGGISYSNERYVLEIPVGDVGGRLAADVTADGKPITVSFTNTYTASGSCSVEGFKTLNGEASGEEFTFGLYEADETGAITGTALLTAANSTEAETAGEFGFTVDFTEAGTRYYIIREEMPAGAMAENGYTVNGMAYDPTDYLWTVEVTDTGRGSLNTVGTLTRNGEPVQRAEFSNIFTPEAASVTFSGKKFMSGRDFIVGDLFTVEVYEADYTVENGNRVYSMTGTEPVASADIEVTEEMAAGSGAAGLDYSVTLSGLDGKGEYSFAIVEKESGIPGVSDSAVRYFVSLTVSDERDADGRLTGYLKTSEIRNTYDFTNLYNAAPAAAQISGAKSIVDEDGNIYSGIAKTSFGFGLYTDETCETKVSDAVWNEDGSFTLTTPEISEDAVYYIAEIIPAAAERVAGITYSSEIYKWELSLEDDLQGSYVVSAQQLSRKLGDEWISADVPAFTNVYKPAPVSAEVIGTKTFENGTLAAGAFSFDIVAVDNSGAPLTDAGAFSRTVVNSADGSFRFSRTFDKAGVYYFIISEQLPAGASAANNYTANGIAYDAGRYGWTVIVTDDGSGVLSAETVLMKNGAVAQSADFTNAVAGKDIRLSKRELGGGNELPGAELRLEAVADGGSLAGIAAPNGGTNTDDVITWVSGTAPATFAKVPDGIYRFTETTAPEGYLKAEVIYVKVSGNSVYSVKESDYRADGSTVWGSPVTADTVIMEDAPTEAYISKVELGGGNEISGAELCIKDSAGKEIANWVSDGKQRYIRKLPIGTYTLTETTAPDGYRVAETMTFSIEPDGTVKANGKTVDDNTVVMEDKPISLILSKRAVGGGSELEGAKLSFKPVDKKVSLSSVDVPDNVEIKNNTISWTSGRDELKISRLPEGVYEFTEITAPDGYDVAETIIIRVTAEDIFAVTQSEYEEKDFDWSDENKVKEDTVIMLDAAKKAPVEEEKKNGSFTFVKKNNLSKPLSGAAFTLSGGEYSKEVMSGADGKVAFTDIPAGTYTLTEKSAPTGYIASAAKVAVYVSEAGIVTFKNDLGTEIQITDIEKLMVNNVKPVENVRSNIKVNQKVNLRDELIKNNAELKNVIVEWVSSNPDIAEVDASGNVTFKKPGQVVITAKNGDNVVGTFVLGATDGGSDTMMQTQVLNQYGAGGPVNYAANPAATPTTVPIIKVPSTSDNDVPDTGETALKWLSVTFALITVSGVTAKLSCDAVKRRKKKAE